MTTEQRIEKEAEEYSEFRTSRDRNRKMKRNAYIAGAITEHKRAQQEIADLKEGIAWKDQQIADLREARKDNSPF